MSEITVRPAAFADVQTVLGTRGPAARCRCQRYKLRRGEAFARFPVEVRADRLRANPGGLVAFLGDEPAGWCAIEPRPAYEGLVRNNRVPWEGRAEDRAGS